jgi:tetratricopeptide (TPR) repeat protein
MFRRLVRIGCLIFALLACEGVQAGGKPDVWLEVRSPHFLVATNGSEKQARRVADQFERMRAIFHKVFPGQRVDPAAPIIVLAAKNEKSFDLLLPQAMLAKGAARPSGLFQRGAEKNYVLLQLDAPGYNPYHTLYHEYTHVLLSQIPVALPPWLDEGLAEFYGNSIIEEKVVQLGRLDEADVQLLRESRLLPLQTLFGVTHSSPYYNENNKVSIFYAESWALVHMLMTEGLNQNRKPLSEYLNNLVLKMDPQAAAVRAFGDLKVLEKQLEAYVNGSGFKYFYAKGDTQVDDQAFTEREMTPAEADALRGDFLVYDGNYDEARTLLWRALQEDAKSAQASESMGFLELQQKHRQEAEKWFTQAIQFDSQSYLAQYYYATMRIQEAKGGEWGEEVASSLRKAIAINPDFAPAYNVLAQYYGNLGENLEEAHLLALQAVTLEPANVYYHLTTVSVLLRMKQADNAVRVCQKALAMAKEPGEMAAAQSMLASAQKYQEYLEKVKQYNEQVEAANARQGSAPSDQSEGQPAGGELQGPPVLRRRDEAPPQLRHRDEMQEQTIPFHSDPAQRGARDTLNGTIQDVKCSLPAVTRMTFASGGKTFELFSENFYSVVYSSLNFKPTGELHPCQDLTGFKAQVFFYDLKGKPREGELISVQLRK